jgi:hypothetical protein
MPAPYSHIRRDTAPIPAELIPDLEKLLVLFQRHSLRWWNPFSWGHSGQSYQYAAQQLKFALISNTLWDLMRAMYTATVSDYYPGKLDAQDTIYAHYYELMTKHGREITWDRIPAPKAS